MDIRYIFAIILGWFVLYVIWLCFRPWKPPNLDKKLEERLSKGGDINGYKVPNRKNI